MEKNKFMNLKKFIKEENPVGQRLQSLRLPRDLNLGGTKLAKKQFSPNLNVIRNKDKAKEFIKKNEQKRKDRNYDNKQNRRKNNNERYVQSTGVFSEGGGDVRRLNRGGDRWSNAKENDVTSFITVPTINKNAWEIDKKNEDNVLDEIMGNDEESDDEKLPFQPITWNETDLKEIKVPIKTEIKKELDDINTESGCDRTTITPVFKTLKLEDFYTAPKEYMEEENCSDDKPTLTLWSLPDSFAGKGLSDDPNCTKLFDYCLGDMLEGQIGKLIIRKSGRAEVYIGRVRYHLEPTDLVSCTEDIVALAVKEQPQKSLGAILGQIQNRFLLNPDWESLLRK